MDQGKKLLAVKVFCSPAVKREPFDGEAEAVSSQNKMGKFDILPEHANFITLIFEELTIHTPDQKNTAYQFEKGVLEVSENKVNVFLGL